MTDSLTTCSLITSWDIQKCLPWTPVGREAIEVDWLPTVEQPKTFHCGPHLAKAVTHMKVHFFSINDSRTATAFPFLSLISLRGAGVTLQTGRDSGTSIVSSENCSLSVCLLLSFSRCTSNIKQLRLFTSDRYGAKRLFLSFGPRQDMLYVVTKKKKKKKNDPLWLSYLVTLNMMLSAACPSFNRWAWERISWINSLAFDHFDSPMSFLKT